MRWLTARERDLHEISELLRSREWNCVSFSERLLRNRAAALPRRTRERILFYRDERQKVEAALLQSLSGVCLPCLPRGAELREQVRRGLAGHLRRGAMGAVMVMGAEHDVRMIESLIPTRPSHSVDYLLMARDTDELSPCTAPDWFEIRRATETDTERLAPLQLSYEIEEVLLPGRTLDRALAIRTLRTRLRKQLVFLAHIGGQPIAMAGTNARGFDYDQIGGVFTCESHRRRGVSRALMAELTRVAAQERRRLCLFVKPANHAATRMYSGMGFAGKGGFRISYYDR